jgi:hypothetical protein
LADPEIDERQVLMAVCDHEPHLLAERPGLLIIADKGYVSAELDHHLARRGVRLIRPSYRDRAPRPGEPLPIRRRRSPHRPTTPGPHRSHLAQRRDRPTRHRS